MTEPILNELDRNSATWKKITKYLESELLILRIKNDNPKKTERGTQYIRGEIKSVRNLMALDKPAPKNESDDDDFPIY